MTVIIDNGVDRIQKDLEGDHRDDTDDALIRQVLDKFYEQHFPNRAENEKFHMVDSKILEMNAKLTEMNTKLKEVDTFLETAKAEFQTIKEASDMSQGTLVEIGEMVFGHEEKLTDMEARVHALENRNAFGD